MEFEKIVQKRVRGMAVRILANIEHTLGADLAGMKEDEQFTLSGAELGIIRSEILNAAGDTTRSLAQIAEPSSVGRFSLSREAIAALNQATLDIAENQQGEEVPEFTIEGNFSLLHRIRGEIKAGVVYKNTYKCVGVEDVIDHLIPFLDSAQIAGIKIAGGDYRGWRDAVCEIFLEGF